MIQTAQAKILWEGIPQSLRLKLLNSVYCSECKKTTGIGHIKMSVESGDLIIIGMCTACGSKVARLVESVPDESSLKNFKPAGLKFHDDYNPDISALIQFRRDSKAADLIGSIDTLQMKSFGNWDPKAEFNDDYETQLTRPFDKILATGKRPCWEMENFLPGFDPDDFDCPIGEGIDIMDTGDWNGAVKHMKGLLKKDPRCLDAYAHLGNWYFEQEYSHDLSTALSFYKTGVAIGMKSINNKVNDVFSWGLINNRPFMRCLHGLGLCFYRQKKLTEALIIFSKMLWLNPSDNQGARFLIKALIDGVSWAAFQKQESL